MNRITISKDFSDVPWGRIPKDGDFCGQNFRENLLLPALKNNQKVTVDLDGVEGLGSSFLEESFGGLVRKGYFTASALHDKLNVVTTKPEFEMYKLAIWRYIDAAVHNK